MKKRSILPELVLVLFALFLLSGVGQVESIIVKILLIAAAAALLSLVIRSAIKSRAGGASASPNGSTQEGRGHAGSRVGGYPFTNVGIRGAFASEDYIVLDTETTGFSRESDKIVEVAAWKVRGSQVTRYHSLVNPGRSIPRGAQKVNRISDAMVANAPTFAQILPALDAFLDPALPIVGHNVAFDLQMLWWDYHDAGQTMGARRYIDTYKLAKKAFPGRSKYSLESLIHDYHLIPGEQTHRADSDVEATRALYELCREKIKS